MTLTRIFLLATAASGMAVPNAAQAGTLLFELTGSRNATFTIETDPVTPTSINTQTLLGGSQIFFNGISGTFNGVQTVGNVNFGSGSILAALNITAPGSGLPFTQFGGPDVFTINNGVITFNTGTFNFSGIVTGSSTLVVSEVNAAVPEPATWAMLLFGFFGVGAAMRRKPTVGSTTVSYA